MSEKKTMTLNLPERESAWVEERAEAWDMSKTAVIRKCIRLGSVVIDKMDKGLHILTRDPETMEVVQLIPIDLGPKMKPYTPATKAPQGSETVCEVCKGSGWLDPPGAFGEGEFCNICGGKRQVPRRQPMTRAAQIEQLAKAWEALGGDRTAKCVMADSDGRRVWYFWHGPELSLKMASLSTEGNDTEDATPALAILRDVYGEDCDISSNGETSGWWAYWHHMKQPVYMSHHRIAVSNVSRIHAVTLALEAKTVRGGV